MKNAPLVYILVLNYNSYNDTAPCINSCRELLYPNFHVLLIDNASPDGSGAKLHTSFPDIEYIQLKKNLGYAGGNNVGIRLALEREAEFVWILNPDIMVEKSSLTTLINSMNKYTSVGIMGPRIIQGIAPKTICFDGMTLYPYQGYQISFNTANLRDNNIPEEPFKVDCVSGCSMLIRKDLFLGMGLIREDFFLYYEDTELCFRARTCGWLTAICRQANVFHRHRSSTKPGLVYRYIERSTILFARTENKCILRTIRINLQLKQFKAILKKKGILKTFQYYYAIIKAILSGTFTPLKPIPRARYS